MKKTKKDEQVQQDLRALKKKHGIDPEAAIPDEVYLQAPGGTKTKLPYDDKRG